MWLRTSFYLLVVTLCCPSAVLGECSMPVTIATFNTALLASTANYTQRAPFLPQALLDNDADIYCLQEFWLESQIENVLTAVKETYPHHFSKIHVDNDTLSDNTDGTEIQSACSQSDKETYEGEISLCIYQNCLAQYANSNKEGTACMMNACGEILKSDRIGPDCIQCLLQFSQGAGVGGDECFANEDLPRNRFNAPGLLYLSKTPFTASYSSYHQVELAVERGYIAAHTEPLGNIVCTHLTSIFPYYFEYNKAFAGYREQYQAEVDTLVNTFNDMSNIILGDLNSGPAVPDKNLSAEYGDLFQRFIDDSYTDPYVDEVGECTFCNKFSENSLSSSEYDMLIDHVLLRGPYHGATTSERIFDTENPMFLSDHFGVQVEICMT